MAEQLEINWANQGAGEARDQNQSSLGPQSWSQPSPSEPEFASQNLGNPIVSDPPESNFLEGLAPVHALLTEGELISGREGPEDIDDSARSRIRLLEQALEQCQIYIDELKCQLMEQAFLEEQLATTEEFSHIQKQAVLALQAQLANRHPLQEKLATLEQTKLNLKERLAQRDADLQFKTAQLQQLSAQAEEEQLAIKQLQEQTDRLSRQVKSAQDMAVHETQQRIIAQTTAERLRTQLRDRDASLQTLENQLQQAQDSCAQQAEIIASVQIAGQSDSHKNQAIQGLSASLLRTQTKIRDLEGQLSNQSVVQAQFQHSTQEYAEKAQFFQTRAEDLEQQVAEMQEQILHQAQQASEYETAVQHWKDRSAKAERTMVQMKQVLEHLLCDRKDPTTPLPSQVDAAISELSKTYLPDSLEPDSGTARRNIKLDLPALLHRWRNTKL